MNEDRWEERRQRHSRGSWRNGARTYRRATENEKRGGKTHVLKEDGNGGEGEQSKTIEKENMGAHDSERRGTNMITINQNDEENDKEKEIDEEKHEGKEEIRNEKEKELECAEKGRAL